MSITGARQRAKLPLLTGTAVALVAAFMTTPAAVSGAVHGSRDLSDVRAELGRGVVDFWRSGAASFPSTLQHVVDYWMVWHATKIVICVVGLGVLTLLARELWTRRLRNNSRVTTAATAVTAVIPLVAFVLAANVQATAAPSIALLPLLPDDPRGPLGSAVAAMRASLAAPGPLAAPSQALVDDVATYQWSMAVVIAVLLIVAVMTAAWSLHRRATAARATGARGMHTTLLVVAAVSATGFGFIFANAVYAATHPATALLDLLGH